jgi:hypothetical protein
MAVKVMYARALRAQDGAAPAALEAAKPARAPAEKPAAEKPKRRKTSVYDADGNEVFITLLCLKCHKMRPLAQFGLRRMADGAIRNQPWCRGCRSDASPKKRKGASVSEGPAVSEGAPACDGLPTKSDPPGRVTPHDAGLLAAQVAAALHAGRR